MRIFRRLLIRVVSLGGTVLLSVGMLFFAEQLHDPVRARSRWRTLRRHVHNAVSALPTLPDRLAVHVQYWLGVTDSRLRYLRLRIIEGGFADDQGMGGGTVNGAP